MNAPSVLRAVCVLIVLLSVAATTATETDGAQSVSLRVLTAWEPDEAMAAAAAEEKLNEALFRWLTAARPSLVPYATSENLTRLLAAPGLQRTETVERKERPYGTVVRLGVAMQIPHAALDAWQAERKAERLLLRIILSAKCGLTLAALVVSMVVTRGLDAWTCGYRRRPLGISLAAILLVLLTVIWAIQP